ncbi:hypothetical protein TeGR_g13366 [Tetraparma gracilis]|uniref:Rhodanese domain-containing protein n=1 Tax=Tetraparma gracilis TaxID=2962635 RepID=A0ABQ6MBE7_9STRA|nr:hypothetical protein TeGR_g13366 [Tetraparma gracilis]
MSSPPPPTHVILFYKYVPLSPSPSLMSSYRSLHLSLASALGLRGRLLLGQSTQEGVNGTFSGAYAALCCYAAALGAPLAAVDPDDPLPAVTAHLSAAVDATLLPDLLPALSPHLPALRAWFSSLRAFHARDPEPFEAFEVPFGEFKWSVNTTEPRREIFPDCYIKVVKEIVGSGGLLSSVPLPATSQGYLTPSEFHAAVAAYNADPSGPTALVDCRNGKEVAIGSFRQALDPKTKTFHEFPRWVDANAGAGGSLDGKKKVLMYCTGGIRCEKASAYVRSKLPEDAEVFHLKGGIHRYLEEFGDRGLFEGKNFVFDSRQGVGETGESEKASVVVGRCGYCAAPWDTFTAGCVCTVCREQVLCCDACKPGRREFHCKDHFELRDCYFTDLSVFSPDELRGQKDGLELQLEKISVGKAFKSRRRTLLKQVAKIGATLEAGVLNPGAAAKCRSCGKAPEDCDGKCWGYFGPNTHAGPAVDSAAREGGEKKKRKLVEKLVRKNNQATTLAKERKAAAAVEEIESKGLGAPLSSFRLPPPNSSVRIPPPIVRTLECETKGKWVGKRVTDMIRAEFYGCKDDAKNRDMIRAGVIRVNGEAVEEGRLLMQGDVTSRTVHWHEPPMHVPAGQAKLDVREVALPGGAGKVYCVNKPCTVPTHPAGQYLANSLTLIAEAELGLPTKSLHPTHRLDKCTSGLVVLADDARTRTLMQQRIEGGHADKTYVAMVRGDWRSKFGGGEEVEVNEKVWRRDPVECFSLVDDRGKDSLSYFRFVAYDKEEGGSVLLCFPKTGRGHQLRCHLKHVGFPIVGDELYGGGKGGGAVGGEVEEEEVVRLVEQVGRGGAAGEGEGGEVRKFCDLCEGGARAAFQGTQLLQGGAAIALHSYQYRVRFQGMAEEGGGRADDVDVLFDTPLPKFALKHEAAISDIMKQREGAGGGE